MPRLSLMTLPPSPYNTKVRLALKLKNLEFDAIPVGVENREDVIEHSGQPLTPVLLDGDRVVYDSFGILRYLDANWPEPRLFDADRDRQRQIQEWENFSREVGATLGLIARQAFSGVVDDDATRKFEERFATLPERVEAALENSDYLMGDQLNAADLSVAPFFQYAVLDPAKQDNPALAFVSERVNLDPRFAKTKAWIERVMQLDAVPVG